MKYNKLNRRHFLQGTAGLAISLPYLPSLMPIAHAQAMPNDKFLLILGSEHGGTGYRDWYPQALRDPQNPFPGMNTVQYLTGSEANGLDHKIRWARLADLLSVEPGHPLGDPDGGQARLSYILGSHFNKYIPKMNMYQGIDIGPEYAGHGTGAISGNISAVGNSRIYRDLPNDASLDQYLAQHPQFYRAGEDTSSKTVTVSGRALSIASDGTSIPNQASSTAGLFNTLFEKYDQSGPVVAKNERRKFLVDRVLADFRNLISGAYGPGRRIASEDKQQVEKHVETLYSLQKKYTSVGGSCGSVTQPSTSSNEAYTDMIVAAFTCGATRLGTYWMDIISNQPAYHIDVAHAASSEDPIAMQHHANNFRDQSIEVLKRFLDKMDAVDLGGGKTLLDQSLVYWGHESGVKTHSGYSVNLVSFGGAGGAIKTGNFVDYRNMSNFGLSSNGSFDTRPGVLVNQWWSTILQAMGVNRSDYESATKKGYGAYHVSTKYPYGSEGYHKHRNHLPYPSRLYDTAGDKLPIIT